MLIRIFSPTECGLIRDADLKKCGLNRMTTVLVYFSLACWQNILYRVDHVAILIDGGSRASLSVSCSDLSHTAALSFLTHEVHV